MLQKFDEFINEAYTKRLTNMKMPIRATRWFGLDFKASKNDLKRFFGKPYFEGENAIEYNIRDTKGHIDFCIHARFKSTVKPDDVIRWQVDTTGENVNDYVEGLLIQAGVIPGDVDDIDVERSAPRVKNDDEYGDDDYSGFGRKSQPGVEPDTEDTEFKDGERDFE